MRITAAASIAVLISLGCQVAAADPAPQPAPPQWPDDYSSLPKGCSYGVGMACPCQPGWHWNIKNQACQADNQKPGS
jgi:hypothetical protein